MTDNLPDTTNTPAADGQPGSAPGGQSSAGPADNAGNPPGSENGSSLLGGGQPGQEANDAPGQANETGDGDGAQEIQYTFDVPQGVTLEGDNLDAMTSLAREAGLSQEQAQTVLNHFLTHQDAHNPAAIWQQQQDDWIAEIKADKAVAQDWDGNLAKASAGIGRMQDMINDHFGDSAGNIVDALNATGAGNHPAIVRAFIAFGDLVREDRVGHTGPPARGAEKTTAEKLYPNFKG